MGKTAIIAGATGLVGKQTLFKLLENPTYTRVYALIRKPITVDHPKLYQITTKFDALHEIAPDILSADDAYCCLGTTMKKAGSKEEFYKVDFTFVVNFARFCQSKGAKNFGLVSAIGASSESKVYYSKVKGEVEEKLKIFRFESYTIIRPSFLLGERSEFRLGERLGIGLAMLVQPFLFGSWAKYKPVHAAKVANALITHVLSGKKGISIIESNELQA